MRLRNNFYHTQRTQHPPPNPLSSAVAGGISLFSPARLIIPRQEKENFQIGYFYSGFAQRNEKSLVRIQLFFLKCNLVTRARGGGTRELQDQKTRLTSENSQANSYLGCKSVSSQNMFREVKKWLLKHGRFRKKFLRLSLHSKSI